MSDNDFFEKIRKLNFDKGHQRPFDIFIERIKANENKIMIGISNITFAMNLRNFDSLYNFVKIGYDLKSIGRNKCKLTFAEFDIAHNYKVLNNVTFCEKQKWELYVPAFKIYVLSGI